MARLQWSLLIRRERSQAAPRTRASRPLLPWPLRAICTAPSRRRLLKLRLAGRSLPRARAQRGARLRSRLARDRRGGSGGTTLARVARVEQGAFVVRKVLI